MPSACAVLRARLPVSGKTTVCQRIVEGLALPWVILLSMDRYYRGLTPAERKDVANYNFDHPGAGPAVCLCWALSRWVSILLSAIIAANTQSADAFDWAALKSSLRDLKQGKSVQVPNYDFATHSR